jgi:CRISPR-associated protein Cas2
MLYLVSYDVEHNRSRTKLADWLLDLGLERVQLSVFMGVISEADLRKITERILHLKGLQAPEATFEVMLLPLAEEHTRKVLWHGGNVPAWDLILNERLTWVI